MKSCIRISIIFSAVAFASFSYGAGAPVGYVFQPNTPIVAQEVNSNFQELADRIASLESGLAPATEPVSFHYSGPPNADILVNGDRGFVITDIVYSGTFAVLSSVSRGALLNLFGGDGADFQWKFETGIVIEPGEVLRVTNTGLPQVSIMISGYYL